MTRTRELLFWLTVAVALFLAACAPVILDTEGRTLTMTSPIPLPEFVSVLPTPAPRPIVWYVAGVMRACQDLGHEICDRDDYWNHHVEDHWSEWNTYWLGWRRYCLAKSGQDDAWCWSNLRYFQQSGIR
jgi:hypothetical protein